MDFFLLPNNKFYFDENNKKIVIPEGSKYVT